MAIRAGGAFMLAGALTILLLFMNRAGHDLVPLSRPATESVAHQPDSPASDVAGESPQPEASLDPSVFFVDVEAGPVRGGPHNFGVPIAIYGKGFGPERGSSKVTIGGSEVASYLSWGAGNAHNKALDRIEVQPGPDCKGGPIVVTVNGKPSNSDHSFSVIAGSIYAVAPTGSDSNSCSLTAPCATISKVVSVMKPGDAVLLREGTYTEGEIWIRALQGGSAGRPKVIKAYPGEEVYLANAARGFLVDADYVTVADLNFQNGKFLAAVGWASRDQRGDRFINNTFVGVIGWAAIEIGGHDHLLAGNVCDISGSSAGTMGHCYYVTQGNNVGILYNIGAGAPGYGLHLYDERRENNDFQRVISNVVVEGNVFRNSRQRSGMIVSMSDAGGYGNHIENIIVRNNIFTGNNHAGLILQGIARGVKVYNNTFYENGLSGIYVEGDSTLSGVDIRNNLIYQSANSACASECGALPQAHAQVGAGARDITLLNNFYTPGPVLVIGIKDPSAVNGNVHFADAARLDFHVQSPSATIDHGVPLAAVATDYDGRRRPQGNGYDIGAFEY